MRNFYFMLVIMASLIMGSTIQAQVYYNEDFESGQGDWVFTDNDGDGYNFVIADGSGYDANLGGGTLASFSYANSTPLNPDNIAVSGAIDLSSASTTNLFLQFDYGVNGNYPAEKYSIYLTTSNDVATILNADPIYTETVAAGGLMSKSIDVTAYAGQTVYLSIRHYDTYDQFFILFDNISIRSLGSNDVELVSANISRYGMINQGTGVQVELKNLGNNIVDDVELTWTDGTDTYSETIGAHMDPGETVVRWHPTEILYADVVEKEITVSVTAVMGEDDTDMSNNSDMKPFNTLSVNSPKKVLIEEGTGTWCGYCPRGAVAMDYMYDNHSDKMIGIAVHNGDPMVVTEYDNGAGFTGFPGMNVDRELLGVGVSQDNMENITIALLDNVKVPADIAANGSLNGNDIMVEAKAIFHTKYEAANMRLGVILVEDGVTGTDSGYNQVNYYAGGQFGPMGGYENLPNPVPAADMVYDHVGIALLGGYDGQADSVPTVINDGDIASYVFNYTLPNTSDINNVKAVVVLIDSSTGQIVNAEDFKLDELGTEDVEQLDFNFSVYPNPTSDVLFLNFEKEGKQQVSIYNVSGKLVDSQWVDFSNEASVNVSNLPKGVYLISVATDGQSFSQQFIKK